MTDAQAYEMVADNWLYLCHKLLAEMRQNEGQQSETPSSPLPSVSDLLHLDVLSTAEALRALPESKIVLLRLEHP